MEITCIIIDDEKPAREELEFMLSDFKEVRILDRVDSASKAVKSIIENQPDFIFLDIHMPTKSGFDVLPEIREMSTPPLVVFVTAYDQYAIKAFEENAIDYVLKPFSEERLGQSLSRVKNLLELNNKVQIREKHEELVETTSKLTKVNKLSVERYGRILLLDPDEIVFCQYKNRKISVHTQDKVYTLYGIPTMDQLENHLKTFSFFRSHRNTIIHFNHIKEFSPWFNGKYLLIMDNQKKTELTLPRERVKTFKRMLGI